MEKSIRRINSKMRKQNRKYAKAIRTNKINKSSKKKNEVVVETGWASIAILKIITLSQQQKTTLCNQKAGL